jgi:hypothetical protein
MKPALVHRPLPLRDGAEGLALSYVRRPGADASRDLTCAVVCARRQHFGMCPGGPRAKLEVSRMRRPRPGITEPGSSPLSIRSTTRTYRYSAASRKTPRPPARQPERPRLPREGLQPGSPLSYRSEGLQVLPPHRLYSGRSPIWRASLAGSGHVVARVSDSLVTRTSSARFRQAAPTIATGQCQMATSRRSRRCGGDAASFVRVGKRPTDEVG